MGRKRIAALCAAAALILTSACSTSEEPSGAVGNSASGVEISTESTASSSNDALRTVTDSLGREVEVPARVETVATQGSAARNVIYAGGLDKIVAVTETDQGPDVAHHISTRGERYLKTFLSPDRAALHRQLTKNLSSR